MKEFFEEIGFNLGVAIAGFFGSLALVGKRQKQSMKTNFFAILTGTASANYITPVVIDLFKIDEKYDMSIAFVLGFLGVKGVEYISKVIIDKK